MNNSVGGQDGGAVIDTYDVALIPLPVDEGGEDGEVGDVDSNDAGGGKDNEGLGDFVLSDGTELIDKGDQLV